jgi:hypothetical protein
LQNLNSGTTYYYRVRSIDSAGNEVISSIFSFTTLSITQPVKTTVFYILGRTGQVAGSTLATSTFAVVITETAPDIKSAFVELTGMSLSAGTNNVQVQVNSETNRIYSIDSNNNYFKILYPVSAMNINLDPATNILYVTPSMDTYIVSARILTTYGYTP